MSTLDKVRELIALAFSISADRVTADTAQADLPAWDSIGHLNLMLMLEDSFGLSLQPDDMVKLTSVRAILKCRPTRWRHRCPQPRAGRGFPRPR